MKTLSIALMAAFMLVLAATSPGQAQNAEYRDHDPTVGGKYIYRGTNHIAQTLIVRGDKLSEINELTLIIEIQGNADVRITFPLLAKRQEGNKLILDYQWYPGGDTYEATIMGGTLINVKTKGWLVGREELFIRE
jgi:hypothetical protein